MVETTEASDQDAGDQPGQRAKRERSLIEFPYSDLGSAIDMAATLVQRGGGSCEEGQLAAWLNQAVGGGTFRARLSASRLFGLIEAANKRLTITPLGRRAADSDQANEAKAEAFLRVPLYASLYEKMNGYPLPPAAAIERQMIQSGVVKTQSDRARQAFTRSVSQAGFIDSQTGRFIKPGVSGFVPDKLVDDPKGGGGGGDGSDTGLHPFIQGLLKTLPSPDTEWPVADRAKWLSTAASIFGLIYKGSGSIKVDAQDQGQTTV